MAPTLLIVDDHAGFRAFARALLEAEGFVVVGEAETGEGAMRAALALEPQIVLVDVVLPDVDGFALCARLTEGASPPVVVLTSSRDASTYRRRLAASRARGFIPKNQLTGAALAALV
jgi:DNA-binding NarL/FixJ family response regulator